MSLNIADFFASVKFKVDTDELKKVDQHLKKLKSSFQSLGDQVEQTSLKIERALGKIKPIQTTAKPKPKAKPDSKGGFTATGFFATESVQRQLLKLNEDQVKSIKQRAKEQEKANVTRAEANALLKHTIVDTIKKNRIDERSIKRTNDLNFAQKRLIGSYKQLAGTFVSVFTAVEAVTSVMRTGMALEGATAGMQAATIDSKDLANSLRFVDEQSVRLGLDLAQTTKDFVKLKAVAKDMKDEDLQDIFLGVAEAGTVLQLSAEDQAGALRARICMAH